MTAPFSPRGALLAASLGLLLAIGPALAQPVDHPGRGQGASQGQGVGQERRESAGQGVERQRTDRQVERSDWRDREADRRRGGYSDRERDYRRGPSVDEREVRRIFRERRDWVRVDERERLPPGIRMNLERGKPLPPGIAQRFDDRLYRELPRYAGYEWRRVGPDAVLVELANDLIHEVLHDVLDH